MTRIGFSSIIGRQDFSCQNGFKFDHAMEAKVARVSYMFDYSCVETVICFIVLYDHSRFIESKPHSQFKHNIWIFSAYITNNNVRIVNILNNAFLNNSNIISIAHELHVELCNIYSVNSLSKNCLYVSPVLY